MYPKAPLRSSLSILKTATNSHASRLSSIRRFSSSPIAAKSAIVTGSARGIGKAVAVRLAKDGFDVTINDVPSAKDAIDQTVEQCKSFGRNALAFPADVTDLSQVNAMVEKTVSELGPLQVMVANAGVVQVKPLLDVTPEDNKFVFDVNYLGVFHCYQAAAKQMLAQGKPPAHPPIEHAAGAAPVPSAGTYKIIGACSIAAMSPYALIGPYCASKWAVRGLSQCFAREMAPNGITVNCYAPGIVGTAMWEQLDEALGKHYGQAAGEVRAQEAKKAALGRVSVPEDVSGLVSYLAGPDSDYMTGQCLAVDGGIIYS